MNMHSRHCEKRHRERPEAWVIKGSAGVFLCPPDQMPPLMIQPSGFFVGDCNG